MKAKMRRLALLAVLVAALAPGALAEPAKNSTAACDPANAPGTPAAVKAIVLNNTAVEVAFLPPNSTACFDAFKVTGKDVATGEALPSRTIADAQSTIYTNLKEGATYEFNVAASSRAKGAGKGRYARAAMPPAFLNAKPGPPERFRAVASAEGQIKLSWDIPAGNPAVDGYLITVRQTNATGYPLPTSGANATQQPEPVHAGPNDRTATVGGLKPSAFYGFVIQSLSSKYGNSDPAFAFRPTPAPGQNMAPEAPRSLEAQGTGNGTVVLKWQPPNGASPDLYVINITQIDSKTGAPLTETNTLPYRNTTAAIGELVDGATYRFAVQSLSVAYDDGRASSLDFTLPPGGAPAPPLGRAAPAPVAGLSAAPSGSGGGARVTWRAPEQGPTPTEYLVQVSDQATRRPLGSSYTTTAPSLALNNLPMNAPLEVTVQSVCDGVYGPPVSMPFRLPYQPSWAPITPLPYGPGAYDIGGQAYPWPTIPFFDPFTWWNTGWTWANPFFTFSRDIAVNAGWGGGGLWWFESLDVGPLRITENLQGSMGLGGPAGSGTWTVSFNPGWGFGSVGASLTLGSGGANVGLLGPGGLVWDLGGCGRWCGVGWNAPGQRPIPPAALMGRPPGLRGRNHRIITPMSVGTRLPPLPSRVATPGTTFPSLGSALSRASGGGGGGGGAPGLRNLGGFGAGPSADTVLDTRPRGDGVFTSGGAGGGAPALPNAGSVIGERPRRARRMDRPGRIRDLAGLAPVGAPVAKPRGGADANQPLLPSWLGGGGGSGPTSIPPVAPSSPAFGGLSRAGDGGALTNLGNPESAGSFLGSSPASSRLRALADRSDRLAPQAAAPPALQAPSWLQALVGPSPGATAVPAARSPDFGSSGFGSRRRQGQLALTRWGELNGNNFGGGGGGLGGLGGAFGSAPAVTRVRGARGGGLDLSSLGDSGLSLGGRPGRRGRRGAL